MKRKWIMRIIAIVAVLAIAAFGVFKFVDNKKNNIEKKSMEFFETLNSYYMESTMEFYKGEDSRTYNVKVSYEKKDNVEYYRVSMFDKATNQEQIIVRNKDGVYVLTPSLNQVYKFKGEWPLNEQKPYLYQTMIKTIQGTCEINKLEDGYLVISTPEYKNMPSWTRQEMKLTKDYKPVWIHIYDDNNDVALKISFTKVEFNPTFSETYFNVVDNINESRNNLSTTTSATPTDLPLYPANALVSATLKEESTIKVNGIEEVLLTYSGQDNFTIIEKTVTAYEQLKEIEVEGEICEIYGTVGYIVSSNNVNKLFYTYNGVSYQIWSNTVATSTLIEIASGMEVVSSIK